MGLKYNKFQNGDRIRFKANPSKSYFYIGVNPINKTQSFVIDALSTNDDATISIILTEVLDQNYEFDLIGFQEKKLDNNEVTLENGLKVKPNSFKDIIERLSKKKDPIVYDEDEDEDDWVYEDEDEDEWVYEDD